MSAKQEELLKALWEFANAHMNDGWVIGEVRRSEREPNSPFADVGQAIKRLLALGATGRELASIMRFGCYSGAFHTLYQLDYHEFERSDLSSLYEGLLMADPSGKDGRPGSAPPMAPKPSELQD